MDLICNAYSNDSDEEQGDQPKFQKSFTTPSSKRPKLQNPTPLTRPHQALPTSNHSPAIRTDAQLPGKYVSKRERALLGSLPVAPDPEKLPTSQVSVFGTTSDLNIRGDILSLLRSKTKDRAQLAQISERMSVSLCSHTKAVNALHWSPTHAHLLASAGMDHTICIWNVWSSEQKIARVLRFHNAAVKDVKWSQQGFSVLSCGFDSSSRLIDVESGVETQIFKEDQMVGVVKFHPYNFNLFLSGGSRGWAKLWDVRSGKVVHEFFRGHDPILDVEFSTNGKQIISSCDITGSNISENSITVWDVSRQVPLSNQVYVEAYTCPCVRYHPFDPHFVAQSNGNYIAIFSSSPPYKLNKYKRYESHGVSGFPIKCSFSLDGEKLVSGSSDGSMYFYDYKSSKLVKKIKAHEQACIDIAVHPILTNVIASCSWNGEVSVFE
nr:WD repeat-containing protein 25-like [Ziziphus jujuba var. spinosa]